MNVNCVITDAYCRKGPKDSRLYDLILYDFERAEPVVSRFNPNGGSKALHHVTLIDDGSSDSQMMRFARALDITSSLDEFRKIELEDSGMECLFLKDLGVSLVYNDTPHLHNSNAPHSFACYKRNELGKVVLTPPELSVYKRDERVGFGENYELDASVKGVYWSDFENTVRPFDYDKSLFKFRLEENQLKHSYPTISDFEIKKVYTASPNDQPVFDEDFRYDQYLVIANGRVIMGFEDNPDHVVKTANSVVDYKTNHAVVFEKGKVYFTKFHDEIDKLLNYEDKSYWALTNGSFDSTERYFGKRSLNVSSFKLEPIRDTECFGLYINDNLVSIGDVKHLDSYHGGGAFFNPDENVGFLFDDSGVSKVEGLDSFKSVCDDFDEYGFSAIVNDLVTNSEYARLVAEHQDLDYAISNLREQQAKDVSKSVNENEVTKSFEDYDLDIDF